MLGISEAAEKMGFRTRGVQLTYEQLIKESPFPSILHWDQNHFVVLFDVTRSFFAKEESIIIGDPAKMITGFTREEFLQHWVSNINESRVESGTVLLLEPTAKFYDEDGEREKGVSWNLLFNYFKKSRWRIIQIGAALLITSLLQLIFPFLTQSIVDTGINTQNLHYITIVLIAQLVLVFSRTVIDFIRSRLLLQVSVFVNLSVLSDFWIKLTRLPISYFDRHQSGDIFQRIGDNKQVQSFFTGSALNTVFYSFNFIIYAIVLAFYSVHLFLVFSFGSFLYFVWVQLFLRIRRKINVQTFHISAKENNATLQLIQGMQEIKLNNAEQLRRWEWENIQVGIFKLNFRSLSYSQFQQAGALLINQGKDVVITFLVAGLVIEGKLTFGAMLAIQYIIGQLSSPIEQFISFVQGAQDAKMSMERLNDIHQLKEEENPDIIYTSQLPENKSIKIRNLSFTYPGAGNKPVLESINLEIPEGKVTAIVGTSGSGKTTLLKLLLKYYESHNGDIEIGDLSFRNINPSYWRRQCGAVMQDGFIFNDTIARNIAVGDEICDYSRLMQSCKNANIVSFVESLANGFNTKLGSEGVGVSQGQKQRILIARAIYKNPSYLFFDEATNALDANNEKAIVQNLEEIFKGRTVVIVAHRLSTVKNADKIVVVHNGVIVEEGTHQYLSARKGQYFELVKNQLELGN